MVDQPNIVDYILAKNEEPNIGKCLRSLQACGIPVVLLDSGSTDRTMEIARQFPFCEVRDYNFQCHTNAWNEITSRRHNANEYVMILDADMEVPVELWGEIVAALRSSPHVIAAPVRMYVESVRYGTARYIHVKLLLSVAAPSILYRRAIVRA